MGRDSWSDVRAKEIRANPPDKESREVQYEGQRRPRLRNGKAKG